MEHSLLHALQLAGTVVALGGVLLMVVIFFPAEKALEVTPKSTPFAQRLDSSVSRWVFLGAALAAVAAVVNVFVDVAEIDGRTLFGGVNLGTVWRFAATTTVGRLSILRIALLLLIALVARLPGRVKWYLVLAVALAAAVCESLVCHAAAQPADRLSAIALELTHIAAASFWLGILVHLLLARRVIESATDDRGSAFLGEILRRFSPIALGTVGLLAITGLLLATRYLRVPAAVATSAYGLTLTVKLSLLLPLIYAGYVNYRVIRPALQWAGQTGLEPSLRRPLLSKFGKTLELEVTAGVLVLTVAGVLASVSPPQNLGTLRLTPPQIRALVSPHLPRTDVVDPAKFVGAEQRTLDDRRYAEFTHNWSGVMVALLGCGWLVMSLGGRAGLRAEKAWPWLFVPLPIFIAVAADPEVWILRTFTLAQVLGDPQVLEHQLGAVLAFVLVGLGLRDRRRPGPERPLGYALPVLMILGSLLLLGHAHSNFTATQELTNLINVQHAIFGAFGLLAGTLRWFELRGLFPDRATRLIWPSLVIGLGLFMTFCYRETY
ncbi:MAG: hypothetical protein C5B50_26345 [Verrucomicrobia bacterium]|nr:MAG: hypothetical protein C5B50_26345 [Verrucomicrobiota bacterium]